MNRITSGTMPDPSMKFPAFVMACLCLSGVNLPAQPNPNMPGLLKLRAEWESARAEKIREIDRHYLPKLVELKVRLMKRNDLKGAALVDDEIRAVEESLKRGAIPGENRMIVRVPANGYSRPLIGTGRVRITPNPTSRWNTSPDRWRDADYRGHTRESEKARNGMSYMILCYKIGISRLAPITGDSVELEIDGEFVLGPSDMEGGGKLENNTGEIEVTIEGRFRTAE